MRTPFSPVSVPLPSAAAWCASGERALVSVWGLTEARPARRRRGSSGRL